MGSALRRRGALPVELAVAGADGIEPRFGGEATVTGSEEDFGDGPDFSQAVVETVKKSIGRILKSMVHNVAESCEDDEKKLLCASFGFRADELVRVLVY